MTKKKSISSFYPKTSETLFPLTCMCRWSMILTSTADTVGGRSHLYGVRLSHMGPGDWTRVSRLSSKYLCPLSHLVQGTRHFITWCCLLALYSALCMLPTHPDSFKRKKRALTSGQSPCTSVLTLRIDGQWDKEELPEQLGLTLEGRHKERKLAYLHFYMKSALRCLCVETDSKTHSRKMWEVLTARRACHLPLQAAS